ncbi:MAG TPA: acylphosphatase [Spirochaetia bacterium]|nr:acylphosphatase [Spirochaetia bacterium]
MSDCRQHQDSDRSRPPSPGPDPSACVFRAVVSGIVQGVSYRAFAQRQAQALDLAGYARNLADGRVEVVALGPRAALESLLERLRSGPALSRVDGLEVDWDHQGEAPRPFAVRR